MGSYRERHVFPAAMPAGVNPGQSVVVTNDVTIYTTTDADGYTLTATRVDTGAQQTTGNIAATGTDASDAVLAQAAIRALGGIYATATVDLPGTADFFRITVFGGYDITWTATGALGFAATETGAAGGGTAVPGAVTYTKQVPIGRFAEVKKLVLKGFADASLDVSIKDQENKNVYVKTGINAASTVVKLLTTDGVQGSDGAADASNRLGGMFKGPLAVILTTSAPATVKSPVPAAMITVLGAGADRATRKVLLRTATKAALSGTLSLGVSIGSIRRISVKAVAGPGAADTSVAPTLTDADGLVVYTKASTDYTTEVLEQLSTPGVDQADSAQAGAEVIAKSPLTISGSGLGSGSLVIKLWVEA